jgi:hypothetical protein
MGSPDGVGDIIGAMFLWVFVILPGAVLVIAAIVKAIARALVQPPPDYRRMVEEQDVLGDARQAREAEIHRALIGRASGGRPQFED